MMDYTILSHVHEDSHPVCNEAEVYAEFEEFLNALTAYSKYKDFEIEETFKGKREYIVVIHYDIAEN